jgi:hexosaminidase
MHWHMVDAVAFPLDTPSSPNMVKGAYSPKLTYSMNDVTSIVDYALDRGVRVLPEIDGPGHAYAWGKGYPNIVSSCPAKYNTNPNNIPLNPTVEKTYDVIRGILSDVKKATNTKYMHLGGDEVVEACWEQDTSIQAYMKANNIASVKDIFTMYTNKVDDIAQQIGAVPVHWEDTFIAGVRPTQDAIFDVWTDSSAIKSVTSEGYRVIAAPSNYWYLDNNANTWERMYSYDPAQDLSAEQASLIVGGEVSMWSEQVDPTNLQPKVWPKAAAVGERLWSSSNATSIPVDAPKDELEKNANYLDATFRILTFRCRMMERGYKAGPLRPGYCPVEYI